MTFINNVKGFALVYKESAKKDLAVLDTKFAKIIEEKLEKLVEGASNLDVTKLKAFDIPTYRLRHGDYRAIYEVYKHKIIVLVVMVGHRKSVYKRYKE